MYKLLSLRKSNGGEHLKFKLVLKTKSDLNLCTHPIKQNMVSCRVVSNLKGKPITCMRLKAKFDKSVKGFPFWGSFRSQDLDYSYCSILGEVFPLNMPFIAIVKLRNVAKDKFKFGFPGIYITWETNCSSSFSISLGINQRRLHWNRYCLLEALSVFHFYEPSPLRV